MGICYHLISLENERYIKFETCLYTTVMSKLIGET
jgi:hypothetical protein